MSLEYLLIRKAGTFVEAPPGIVDSVYDHQGKSEATNGGGGGGVNCDIRIYREHSLKLFFSQSNWPEKLLFLLKHHQKVSIQYCQNHDPRVSGATKRRGIPILYMSL